MKSVQFQLCLTAITLAVATFNSVAQTAPTTGLSAAAQKAIDSNPDVTARLNALRAATNEVDVARGGYFPRVDVDGRAGRVSEGYSGSTSAKDFSATGISISAKQMLWDGLATRHEVERMGHARLTRYFEFLQATQDASLEAARAYLDVLRYRKLVDLAEDNYIQHKYVQGQLQSKVKAGVGRGVDFEQANARLALADSNLTTEVANLHDVSTRYLRVVGEAPAKDMPAPTGLDRGLAATQTEMTNQAVAVSPTVEAAVENMRAARLQAQRQDAAYQPTVEARIRSGVGHNYDTNQDMRRETVAELVLNWNLFNGGSDRARARQYADLINQAADDRDKACRDVRQTASIAYNDIQKLKDQLLALDRNVLAIEKTRNAYRQQFDIGQRSLLDLLNAENELYTAKRSYANAEFDLQLAYARTQAAQSSLTTVLGLSQGQNSETSSQATGEDGAQRCPATVIELPEVNRDRLAAEAAKLEGTARAATAPTPATDTPATPAPSSATPPNTHVVADRLRAWVAAWQAKDVAKYLSFYSSDFAPKASTHAQWQANRQRALSKDGAIEIKLSNISAERRDDQVITTFDQTYNHATYQDHTIKVLTWKKQADQWVIVAESNR